MKPMFEIMDVTCRDGSYVNNFRMSTAEEKNICRGLEKLGYKYAEIGHGMGLGASKRQKALQTDEEYLKCAYDNLKEIKYGVFCIPEIAELDDVRMAHEYGCSFIRIGCNVEDIDKTENYVKLASKLGITVMSNYMKSYATGIDEFKEAVKKSEAWGSELIYIVDSAGSMLPYDIDRYYEAIRENCDLKIGFHGHDNIGMALANSIHAVELGVDFIDCSLQGLGRSAGNTSLEHFTVCMQKMGYELGIDEIEMLLLSRKFVYPMVKGKGINPIDTECGIAGFHSSYLQTIHKVASEYEVNPLALIEEYSKNDRVNMNEQLAEKIAEKLPKDFESLFLLDFDNYLGGEQ